MIVQLVDRFNLAYNKILVDITIWIEQGFYEMLYIELLKSKKVWIHIAINKRAL